MHSTTRIALPLALAGLALGLAACSAGPTPSPTTPPPAPVVEATPATPTATPSPTSTAMPTAAPSPTPPATPSPTAAPWAGQLPAGTIALASAGDGEEFQLQALSADGALTGLGLTTRPYAVASRSGRWVACPAMYSSSPMQIYDLEQGTVYTIPPGWEEAAIQRFWAFDAEETRLAYSEDPWLLSSADGDRWAIVVVNLADGSATRFESPLDLAELYSYGAPLGWAANGDLVLATFDSGVGGGYGIWAQALPPGSAPAPLSSLHPRRLLPDGACQSIPHLSPDGTRLLYLGRNEGYTPANYSPLKYRTAVNQLWSLDVASGTPQLLVEVTDGGALGYDAAWSPDGSQILFAEGHYAGEDFSLLTLKVRGPTGDIRDVGLLPSSQLERLAWCTPETALAEDRSKPYLVDLASGRTTPVATTESYIVLVVGAVAQ